jgi:hypothetical protein
VVRMEVMEGRRPVATTGAGAAGGSPHQRASRRQQQQQHNTPTLVTTTLEDGARLVGSVHALLPAAGGQPLGPRFTLSATTGTSPPLAVHIF